MCGNRATNSSYVDREHHNRALCLHCSSEIFSFACFASFFLSLSLYTSNLEALDRVFVHCDPLSEVSKQANFAAVAQLATSNLLPIMFGQLKAFALGAVVFNLPGVNAHSAQSLMERG
jgi:hypothetical protein